jgi:hypothetical protein
MSIKSDRENLQEINPYNNFPGSPTDKRYSRKYRHVQKPKQQSILSLFNKNLLVKVLGGSKPNQPAQEKR